MLDSLLKRKNAALPLKVSVKAIVSVVIIALAVALPLLVHAAAGAEGGHTCICMGGEMCGCGSRGCYEAYASVSALIRQTERAMKAHPESLMNEIAAEQGLDGKTAFIAMKRGDKVAKEVVCRGGSRFCCRQSDFFIACGDIRRMGVADYAGGCIGTDSGGSAGRGAFGRNRTDCGYTA